MPSVASIIEDSKYSPKPSEEATIERHISNIPQLGYRGDGVVVGELPKSVANKNSRRADLKSLRESLNRIRRDPERFFEYQDPKEFLNPPAWNQAQPSNKHSQTLDQIHEKIETTHPALSMKRLVCETIYFFSKHQLISQYKLGILLSGNLASQAFSRHILESFAVDHTISRNWLPLNLKNILNNWFHFSCGNMFEGMPETSKQTFLYYFNRIGFEYYRYYPAELRNQRLKGAMNELEDLLFDKNPTRPENLVNASGNQRSFSLNVKSSSVEKLARLFIDIQQHPDSPSELAHLFQVIDYFNNINPRAFQTFKDTPDFQTKFDSMSSSRQFLAQLENLQIYLETEFNQRRWLNSIFDQSTVNPKSISPLEELQILAKYIKIIEAKYIKKFGMVTESSQLYQYCQHKLFQECLRATKSMMLKLVTSS
ncbi:uncharacterized protein PGTG_14404 [Puccinia graminis f. sp. tritici CRL 75-36-700-3]|uniref:Uncharacterized protein n=1 Tax=Puccinia graminis f. sp. tritici (strain CRL 75-36-700-3 / race SCCL) TaxID=418459 RepID=E3KVI0_PUCGT|nr:uncharacterized protein PGTG_14404 [Puccinia graminis f. sp. tritici CRL 75-36-700-3]EFP88320.2 hypothetical protein PGTG_14404 [Puccinia graminis f. sp. tritici CRL 75-36-700-3]